MSSAVTSAAVARKKSPEAGPPLRQTRPPWVRGALAAALRALAAARLSEMDDASGFSCCCFLSAASTAAEEVHSASLLTLPFLIIDEPLLFFFLFPSSPSSSAAELSAAALAAAPPSAPPAASRSKSVVLPLPEGPTIATNCPGQTWPLHGCRMRLRSPVAALKTSTEAECHERSVGKRATREDDEEEGEGEGEGEAEKGGGTQRVGQ